MNYLVEVIGKIGRIYLIFCVNVGENFDLVNNYLVDNYFCF